MSFADYTCAELRKMIAVYKNHHNINNSSKLKKADLMRELDSRFIVRDDKLFLKLDGADHNAIVRTKKQRGRRVRLNEEVENEEDNIPHTVGRKKYNVVEDDEEEDDFPPPPNVTVRAPLGRHDSRRNIPSRSFAPTPQKKKTKK